MRRILVVIGIITLMLAFIAAPAYAQATGDITRFGSSVTIPKGETVTGNVTVFGGSAFIDGRVDGNVTVFGGGLTINDTIGGNVTHFGGTTTLGDNAVIDGNFTHFGGSVSRSSKAVVRGNETTGPSVFNPFATIVGGLLSLVFSLLLAAAVAAVFPTQTAVLADTVESRALPAFGAGFATTILLPLVFVILAISIIGIIFIPFVAIALPFIYFYGYVGISRWLGRRVLQATRPEQQSPVVQAVVGVLIFGLIGLIPILGWLVVIVASFIGLGAVILSKFGTGRPWFRRAAAPTPPTEEEKRGAA